MKVRTEQQHASWRRFVASVALALTVLATLLPVPAARAAAVLTINLHSVTPTMLTDTGDLTVTGSVVNADDVQVRDVQVRLWRDATPLTTSAAVERALASDFGGAVSEDPRATSRIGTLNSNTSGEFSVAASLDPSQATEPLWLSQPNAVYRVGVEVYGIVGSSNFPTLLGSARFPIAKPGTNLQANSAVVVELTSAPSLLPAAASEAPLFRDDHLPVELTGRLHDLLGLAEQPNSTVLIDPALRAEIVALAAGASVGDSAATATAFPPAVREQAAAWLARLDAVIAHGHVYRTLWGNPDLQLIAAAEQPDVINRAVQSLTPDDPLAALPLMIHPIRGGYPAAVDGAIAALGPAAVLADVEGSTLPAGSSDAEPNPVAMRVTDQGTPLVRTIPAPVGVAGPAAVRAHQLIDALEHRSSVAVIDSTAGVESVLAAPAWVSRVELEQILGQAADSVSLDENQTAPSPDELVSEASRLQTSYSLWSRLSTSKTAPVTADRAVVGAWSQNWRTLSADDGYAASRRAWISAAREPLSGLDDPSKLRIRITDSVTTANDDNFLPVTIVNDLPFVVNVRVSFTSANAQRVSIPNSDVIAIRPGESATVRVSPHSEANGPVAMTAQLTSSDGTPVGAPVDFTVTATQAGQIGWVIIVVSGIVLLAATAMRVRQVRRHGRVGVVPADENNAAKVTIAEDRPVDAASGATTRQDVERVRVQPAKEVRDE